MKDTDGLNCSVLRYCLELVCTYFLFTKHISRDHIKNDWKSVNDQPVGYIRMRNSTLSLIPIAKI
jgi:hypothetical protein